MYAIIRNRTLREGRIYQFLLIPVILAGLVLNMQLYRKVSGLTGIAVNELIRKLRLQRAAQLLAQEWGPVSQVAYEVGFSNLSYFSKVFKEEFGVLPSEYNTENS